VLVIKLGALGDVVLAFQAFADIKAHHPGAEITLLTTAPFAPLLAASPWFDRIAIDRRPVWWNLPAILALRRTLRGFDQVYDLQTSHRSCWYFHLAGRPRWSGIARGASHPHANPRRNHLHTIARQRDQLAMAGVPPAAKPCLDWLTNAALSRLPERAGVRVPGKIGPYALLIPGAAPHRPEKRWPAERFGELATHLMGQNITPVIAGTAGEKPLAAIIQAACPRAIDLTGQTSLPELAALAGRAAMAVGNDTGPMHLAAAVGCPGVVLFGRYSDPALTAPPGMTVLRAPVLADLPTDRVAAALPQGHTDRLFAISQPEARPCPP
jgi:ADP-heptose:LPS heptosyltransferase